MARIEKYLALGIDVHWWLRFTSRAVAWMKLLYKRCQTTARLRTWNQGVRAPLLKLEGWNKLQPLVTAETVTYVLLRMLRTWPCVRISGMAPSECICFISVDEHLKILVLNLDLSSTILGQMKPPNWEVGTEREKKKTHTCVYTCTDLSKSIISEEVTFQTQVSEQVEGKWLHEI